MRDIGRYETDYVARYGFERHMVRYRRRQVVRCLAHYRHDRILEVGCGLEPLFEHIPDWTTYTIVEPAPEFAERARRLIPAGRVVEVRQELIERVAPALASQEFDFVVVSSLLHEVRDPLALLGALRELCRSETTVHVNVPNARSLHNRIAVRMGIVPDLFAQSEEAVRMQRTSTFDLQRLTAMVEQAGFHVDTAGSYFLKPFSHGQLQRMLDHGIIDDRVLDALFEVNDEFAGLGAEVFVNMRIARTDEEH